MRRARPLLRGFALAAALGWLAVLSPLAAQDMRVAMPRPIVIIGGMLIDGSGAPARRNDAIVIRDGRIAAMGLSAARKAPKDARLIEGTGKWILPGLVDAAVHLYRSGNLDAQPLRGDRAASIFTDPAPASLAEPNSGRAPAQYLRAYLCAGVTTVMNIGGPLSTFDLRDGRTDDALSPRVATTGPVLRLLPPSPAGPTVADERALAANSSEQAAGLIEGLRPSKPDLVAFHFGASPGEREAEAGLAEAAVAAAHARHLRALAEVSVLGELLAAVTAHADVIVSRVSEPIDEDTIQRIVRQHIVIVPVMTVDDLQRRLLAGDGSVAEFEAPCAPGSSLDFLAAFAPTLTKRQAGEASAREASAVEGQQRNVRRLVEAGATIVAGSGAGEDRVFHGPSLHREFELLAGAGLTPGQILLSATRDAAALLGRPSDLGQIKEGMAADLVLVAADPLADIRNAGKVVLTIRGGALYER